MKPTRSPPAARPLMKLETPEPQVLRRRHRCRPLPLKTSHADSLDLPGRRAWIKPTSHRDSSSRWTCRRRGLSQEGRHRGRHRLAVSQTSRMPLLPGSLSSEMWPARRRSRRRLFSSFASSSHAALAHAHTYRSFHLVSLTRGRCCVQYIAPSVHLAIVRGLPDLCLAPLALARQTFVSLRFERLPSFFSPLFPLFFLFSCLS